MVNLKEQAKNVVITVERKAIPVAVSAATALSTVCVTAFAAEGASGSDTSMYQTLADSFKTGVTNMSDGIALVLGAIVPIGVGIIGLMSAIGAGKKILAKLSG